MGVGIGSALSDLRAHRRLIHAAGVVSRRPVPADPGDNETARPSTMEGRAVDTSGMNEMKLATWRFPIAQWVPAEVNAATMLTVDLASHPDLVGHIADWEAVSHTIHTMEDEVIFSVLLRRVVVAPDSLEGLD